ncbi:SDR family oxidoreductase [Streptomyces goshikiensis]|uniref:SDR family oxidoreductase n=1 Tax=Streptomyces goshikiensis TaxID=1942 RepID=UPI0036BAF500
MENPSRNPARGLPAPPALGAAALPPGTYEGQVVLVTGGGSGLGKAIAAEFARLGADLVIAGRRAGQLKEAREELAAVPGAGRVTAAVCDIRDPERVAEVFDAAQAAVGLPDVLVNNAAANFPSPAEDLTPGAWRAVVDITLTGTWFMTREFGRRHLAAGTPGSIVNIGASYAWTGGPGFAHSAAAKAGVKNLVETLAVEWGPYGIQINGLVPGLFPHPDLPESITAELAGGTGAGSSGGTAGRSGGGSGGGSGGRLDGGTGGEPSGRTGGEPGGGLDARQPALRVGAPRELGWAATFLASPYARFVTGHTLVVDGANWQRRTVVNPELIPLRTQLGRGPFTP